MLKQNKPIFIGVSGPSGAGKDYLISCLTDHITLL